MALTTSLATAGGYWVGTGQAKAGGGFREGTQKLDAAVETCGTTVKGECRVCAEGGSHAESVLVLPLLPQPYAWQNTSALQALRN